MVAQLLQLLQQYNATAVPPLNQPWDPLADPKYWGYNYVNWLDFPPPVGVNATKIKMQADAKPNQKLFDYFKTQKSKIY